MRMFKIKGNNVCYIFFSSDEQETQGSKCYFNLLDNEILFEIRNQNDELLGFRIYAKKADINKLIQQLKQNKYFTKEIDRNFEYLCD